MEGDFGGLDFNLRVVSSRTQRFCHWIQTQALNNTSTLQKISICTYEERTLLLPNPG